MKIGLTQRYWNAEIVLRMREKGLTNKALATSISEKIGCRASVVEHQIHGMRTMRWRPRPTGHTGRNGRQGIAASIRRECVVKEFCSVLGLPMDLVCPEWMTRAPVFPTSIETVKDFTPNQLASGVSAMLSLPAPKSTEDILAENEIADKLVESLRVLNHREREIIKLRYGIGGGRTYTLKEVGRIFKITRERVRMIEAKAIRKLQEMHGTLDCFVNKDGNRRAGLLCKMHPVK